MRAGTKTWSCLTCKRSQVWFLKAAQTTILLTPFPGPNTDLQIFTDQYNLHTKKVIWSFRKLFNFLLFHWGIRLQEIRLKKCSVSLFTCSRFQWTTPSEQLKHVLLLMWKSIQQMLYLEYFHFHQTGNGSWNLPAITQELFESLFLVVTQKSSHLKQQKI